LILLLPIFISCGSTGCYNETDVKVYCSFYSISKGAAVSLDSLSVWGVGSDSLIYKKQTISQLALELNPNSTKTQYVVQSKTGNYVFTDTLTFIHTNKPWYESKDCDCMVFSTLDTCLTTGGIFQYATIPDHNIINYEKTHVVLHL